MINTDHRERYDDFKIHASDYKFLNDEDRFLSCSRLFAIDPADIKKEVGTLNEADTRTLIEKIVASRNIPHDDKKDIIAELSNSIQTEGAENSFAKIGGFVL